MEEGRTAFKSFYSDYTLVKTSLLLKDWYIGASKDLELLFSIIPGLSVCMPKRTKSIFPTFQTILGTVLLLEKKNNNNKQSLSLWILKLNVRRHLDIIWLLLVLLHLSQSREVARGNKKNRLAQSPKLRAVGARPSAGLVPQEVGTSFTTHSTSPTFSYT